MVGAVLKKAYVLDKKDIKSTNLS